MRRGKVAVGLALALIAATAGWGALHMYRQRKAEPVKTSSGTVVKRGDVAFPVHAKGELIGGNTEMLTAPMVGGAALTITSLRESGELVQQGDVVVEFDTTEQEYRLREAEADVAEAEQQLAQAQAESKAREEEARHALTQAKAGVRIAEIEIRRNELLPALAAKQNLLALEAAKDRLKQLDADFQDRIATAKAGIAIQQAGRQKAKVASDTARRNIASMTLRAKTSGYTARQQNMEGNTRWGTYQPPLQPGDTVRSGMAVAQIPDLKNWEISARFGELDRGHLAVGQQAEMEVVALPERRYHGKIKNIGGTTGPQWDRYFECRITIDDATADLRPGMTARLRVMTEVKQNALWVPSQALFERDGRRFVYVEEAGSFEAKEVKLVRRSESQAVIEGLREGQRVSLVNPELMKKQKRAVGGAMDAVSK